MATIGYARVSTKEQVNHRQEDALNEHGVDKLFADKKSGATFDRIEWNKLIEYAREGDTVVVASFDRLGRSLLLCIQAAQYLAERGINLRSLREGIDFSTSTGRMLAGIFASLAEYERSLINERAAEARAAAQARGLMTGRPPSLSDAEKRQIKALHAAGESVSALVETFGVSRRTVYRALDLGAPSAA